LIDSLPLKKIPMQIYMDGAKNKSYVRRPDMPFVSPNIAAGSKKEGK
jgi:hypothetical protein